MVAFFFIKKVLMFPFEKDYVYFVREIIYELKNKGLL